MAADLDGAVGRLLKLNHAFRDAPNEDTLHALIDALDRFISRPECLPDWAPRALDAPRQEVGGCAFPREPRAM